MNTLDHATCHRAVASRDTRFDGVFWTAVRTTGIYCRPSCPARTPAPENCTFLPSAASAQVAGYRACKRCLPDAAPGSPEWDLRADLAGRAMRLIADGVVDRGGVAELALRLGYSSRHLNRLLVEELGAGPLALARARRAQNARTLLESADLTFADVAFAAGFSSVRQFNTTMREVYDASPTELARRGGSAPRADGALAVRIAVRTPFAGQELLNFLALRAVPGVETVQGSTYARTLRLPRAHGTVEIDLVDLPANDRGTAPVEVRLRLVDLRDTSAAVERVRRLLDADADPRAVDEHLAQDPMLAAAVTQTPGLRVPGHVSGAEVAIRAILGQQISVKAARTHAARLVQRHGSPVLTQVPGLDRLFPTMETIAASDVTEWAMPRRRAATLVHLAGALARAEIDLDRGADRDHVREQLLALPGIGPWTADYIAMRALGHPNVFLPTDTGVRDGLRSLGIDRAGGEQRAQAWSPWRSYALMHLWQAAATTHEPSTSEPGTSETTTRELSTNGRRQGA